MTSHPDVDPYALDPSFSGGEETLNVVGNTAGILALGRSAFLLGGLGLAGYGAYRLLTPKKKPGIVL